ncbi:MAG: tRNA (adenosine(37)-N6)-threonylcarbamoyltransferase complex dimerization subunit type 1 TsaB [Candidatus Bipolaricaulia bacterium]
MLTLGIDTAEPIGGVALFDDGVLAEERLMEAPLRHAESLIPLVEGILEDSSASRGDIERVSVNRGPGSFTGLRIGLATAKGLCQALGATLVGIDGTVAYRSRLPEARRVCVVLQSRRDLFYARWFVGLRPKEPIHLMHEEELVARLRGEDRELTLVGSGAGRVFEQVVDHAVLRLAPEELMRPSPLVVARLGASAGAGDRLYEVEPLYVEPVLV